MQLFKIELSRALKNKLFLAVLLFETTLVIIHVLAFVLPTLKDMDWMLETVGTVKSVDGIPGVFNRWFVMKTNAVRELFFITLPILAAIPFGASLYIDEKNQYINNIAVRTNRKNYYIAKMTALFVSGGLVGTAPMILSMLINMCILPVDKPQSASSLYYVGVRNILGDLFFEMPWVYVVIYLFWVFFIAGLLTTFCFTASCIMENRFVVIMAPYTLYFVSYVMGNLLTEEEIPLPWIYIQFNKITKSMIGGMCLQILLLILINALALGYKCYKKRDII